MTRRGRANIFGALLLLSIGAAFGAAALFGPYYWDQQVMEEVVRSSALEWYATENRAKAEKKLARELVKRELDEYIYASDCTFNEQGELVVVYCFWGSDVYYPGTKYYKSLDFETTVEVNRRGDFNQY